MMYSTMPSFLDRPASASTVTTMLETMLVGTVSKELRYVHFAAVAANDP
jgi:hypothetical protein